jgi:hypothetical protein
MHHLSFAMTPVTCKSCLASLATSFEDDRAEVDETCTPGVRPSCRLRLDSQMLSRRHNGPSWLRRKSEGDVGISSMTSRKLVAVQAAPLVHQRSALADSKITGGLTSWPHQQPKSVWRAQVQHHCSKYIVQQCISTILPTYTLYHST